MGTPKGKMVVCKVEYETKDHTNWKAIILAYDMKAAIMYLQSSVRDYDKYISTQIIGSVDAIEPRLFQDYLVSTQTKVVETVVNVAANDEPPQPQCPWCKKEFKNTNTLGNHIKKYHMTEEA